MKLASKRLHKKGSLELSVNAIVILVMAIAVLGLGLAFIRGALLKGQGQVFRAIDNAQLENPASADRPLTLDYEVSVSGKKAGDLHVGFYNDGTETVKIRPEIIHCYNSQGNEWYMAPGEGEAEINVTLTGKITVSTGALEVKAGESQAFIVGTNVDSSTPAGRYTCVLDIKNTLITTTPNSIRQGQFFVQYSR